MKTRFSRLAAVSALAMLAAGCGGGSASSSSGTGNQIGAVQPDGASPTSQAITATSADSGFRPDKNGFSFANYGNDVNPNNLTPTQVRDIFGDGVCANLANGCELTPPAQAWMDDMNKQMAGGHCFGFSVTAMLMFKSTVDPSQYGASGTSALQIQGNLTLQQRIAESMSYQFLDSVQSASVFGTPNDIIAKLKDALQPNATELYTIGIINRQKMGGHAVTPFALEDKGNGHTAILIYDNNWPSTVRAIDVDTTANTWSYLAAPNPSEPSANYDGDATTKSLWLIPTTPAVGKQPCPFCAAAAAPAGFLAPAASARLASYQRRDSAWLTAAAPNMDLSVNWDSSDAPAVTIQDSSGNDVTQNTAWTNGTGLSAHPVISGHDYNVAGGEDFKLPAGSAYTVTLDGTSIQSPANGDVDLLAQGQDLTVNNITVEPGKKVVITYSADVTKIGYTADDSSPPTITLGEDGAKDDGEFSLTPNGIAAGDAIGLDLSGQDLVIDNSAVNHSLDYGLSLTSLDSTGETTFSDKTVSVPANQTGTINWSGDTPENPEHSLTLTESGGGTETLTSGG